MEPEVEPEVEPEIEPELGQAEDVAAKDEKPEDPFAALSLISKELDGLDKDLGVKIDAYTPAKEDEGVRKDVEVVRGYFRSPVKPGAKSGSPGDGSLYTSNYVGRNKAIPYNDQNPLAGYLTQPPVPYGRQGLEQSSEQYAHALRQEAERYRQRDPVYRVEGNPLARPLPKSYEEVTGRTPPIPGKVIYSKPPDSPPQPGASFPAKPASVPVPAKTTPPYRPYAPN